MSLLLLVDDDESLLLSTALMFEDESSIEVLTATSAKLAATILMRRPVDVIISDQNMPLISGIDFLKYVHEHYPGIQRIILTGDVSSGIAVGAINKAEVFRFLVKPCSATEIIATVKLAAEVKKLRDDNEKLALTVTEQNDLLTKNNVDLERTVEERTAKLLTAVDALKEQNENLKAQRTSVAELVIAMVGQYDRKKGRIARLMWESIRFYAEKNKLKFSEELPFATMLKIFVDPVAANGDDTFLRLLSSVEGFSSVAAIIMGTQENYSGGGPMGSEGKAIPAEARLLRIAADYNTLNPEDLKLSRAYIMENLNKLYDPDIAPHFLASCHDDLSGAESIMMEIDHLLPGMVLSKDLQLTNGATLLPTGVSLNITIITQLRKLKNMIKGTVFVFAEIKDKIII